MQFLQDLMPTLRLSKWAPYAIRKHLFNEETESIASLCAMMMASDGEYERLMGRRPAADRFDEARALAQEFRSVVLLKGPATIVAEPNGAVQVVNNGDARLATAGTGDVLAGIIGSLLAQGTPSFEAAAAGAWLHGHAASLRPRYGMVASDLLDVLPEALHETHMG